MPKKLAKAKGKKKTGTGKNLKVDTHDAEEWLGGDEDDQQMAIEVAGGDDEDDDDEKDIVDEDDAPEMNEDIGGEAPDDDAEIPEASKLTLARTNEK
mmetsp:Transcript_36935/g.67653  ORF Transcript_36935/g.67653 Transcript_36935/m.67653 type:complete len:97 (+) Transcript_36935:82-372(+)